MEFFIMVSCNNRIQKQESMFKYNWISRPLQRRKNCEAALPLISLQGYLWLCAARMTISGGVGGGGLWKRKYNSVAIL